MPASLDLLINAEPLLPGQTVRGALTITVPPGTVLHVSGIYLQFRGYERIRFRQRADAKNQSVDGFGTTVECSDMSVNTGIPTILPISQPHFLQKVLTSLTIPISRFRDKLPAESQNSFQFDFKLEGKLPPSMNLCSGSLKYSATIEYEIIVQVFCKNRDDNLTLSRPVKLMNLLRKRQLASFLEQELELKASLKFCLFGFCRPRIKSIEPVQIRADWKRNNFTSGDTVDFDLNCGKGLLSVKLVRELFLIIDVRNSFRVIEPIAKSRLRVEDGTTQMVIPRDLEATVRTRAIDCRYFFVFEVKLKGFETSLTSSEVLIY